MKKLFAIILLVALTVSLFAGCGEKYLTEAEVKEIALEDLGIKEDQAESIHTHVTTVTQGPAYSIHVNYEGQTYEYIILAATGEILNQGTIQE